MSMPNSIDNKFIDEFYKGALKALNGAKIIGGDITGSKNDIIISITAIGDGKKRNISSRKNAKEGYIIITHGLYGSSALGLKELFEGKRNSEFTEAHLEPKLYPDFSRVISENINEPYAMMDTSDGLADALFKIAESSNIKIVADYNKIPHSPEVEKKQVLFGGEDYNLVAAIPEKYIGLMPESIVIGKVLSYDGIRVDISGDKYSDYSQLSVYNHFGE